MDKKSLDKKLEEWIKELPQESRKSLLARLSGLKSISIQRIRISFDVFIR